MLSKPFAKNYVWVASNLAKESVNIKMEEAKNLFKIFNEFIPAFMTNEDD